MMSPDRRYRKPPIHLAGGLAFSICVHFILLQLPYRLAADKEAPHRLPIIEVELVNTATAQEVSQAVKQEAVDPEHNVQENPVIKRKAPKPVKKKITDHQKTKTTVKKTAKARKHPPRHHVREKASPVVESRNGNTATKNSTTAHLPSHNQAQLKQIRQEYLSRILSMVRSHKHYPYSARRRRIEGDVQVSFTVDKQGNVHDLHVTGGASALRAATHLAIEDALPFPPPPGALSQPPHLRFIMQYRLK